MFSVYLQGSGEIGRACVFSSSPSWETEGDRVGPSADRFFAEGLFPFGQR